MTRVMRYGCLLLMTVLCLNPAMNMASQRNFPVPPLFPMTIVTTTNPWNWLSLCDQKKQIMIIATGIVIASIIYYVYKQNCIKKAEEVATKEMATHIKGLTVKLDSCIDSLLLPTWVKEKLKLAITGYIATCIGNAKNSVKRYVQKNKKYFISIAAAPTGMWLGYPVSGGAVAMFGVAWGAIQSAREEIAEFRQKTEQLFAETNQKIDQGFENAGNQAEKNKEEVFVKIDQKTEELFGKIGEISEQISEMQNDVGGKIDNVDGKVEKLSLQLINLTKEIKLLPDQINANNKQELDGIKVSLQQIDGKQIQQAETLKKVQGDIEALLDKNETQEKQLGELLSAIQTSNLSLENVKTNSSKQDQALQRFQTILDNIHGQMNLNHDNLSSSIGEFVRQCSDLSNRVANLEVRVDGNCTDIKILLEQNKKLEVMLERVRREADERENKFLNVIDGLKSDLKATAHNLNQTMKDGFDGIERKLNQPILMLPAQLEQPNSHQQPQITYKQEPAVIELQQQLRILNNS